MKISQLLGFASLAISLGLLGCGEIENPVEPTPDPKHEEVKSEITIDADIITNGLSFTSEKGEKSISFTTNEDWTLSIAAVPSGDAWCTASATRGAKGNANVKFAVTENASYDDRSVSVTIKSGTASKSFSITQKCAETPTQAIVSWAVEFNDEEFSDEIIFLEHLTAETYQLPISFSTNFDWSLEVSIWSGEGNWCYVIPEYGNKGSHSVVLTILENDTSNMRHATIYLRCKNESRSINILQFHSIITEEAGTLKTQLDNIYGDVESLIIKGYMNGDDIAALREFYSYYSQYLKRLDLSKVMIVKGGSFEYKKHLGFLGSEWRMQTCDEDNVIPDNMFNNGFGGLEELILPASATSIGDSALEECRSLKRIKLPDSVISIGNDAFSGCCWGLTEITIPKNVKKIEYEAFHKCNKLETVTCLAETAPQIKHIFTDNTVEYAFEEGYVGTLLVPKFCSSSYRSSDWRLFFGIHELKD